MRFNVDRLPTFMIVSETPPMAQQNVRTLIPGDQGAATVTAAAISRASARNRWQNGPNLSTSTPPTTQPANSPMLLADTAPASSS